MNIEKAIDEILARLEKIEDAVYALEGRVDRESENRESAFDKLDWRTEREITQLQNDLSDVQRELSRCNDSVHNLEHEIRYR